MNFSINLDGDLAASANKDADALERLQGALRAEEKALGAMEKQMKALQKASSVDVATFQKLDGAIKASRDKIAGMTGQLVGMGATGLDPAKEKAFNLSSAFSSLQQRAGPVGKFLAALGPWGVAAAIAVGALVVGVVALVGVCIAAAAGLQKLVDLAAEFSEKRGDAERMLTTIFDSEKAAERTYNAIEDVTKRVAISQEKAIEVADSLAKAGVYSGDAMVRAVESIGKAEAARKGAGQVIQGIIERSEKSRQAGFGNMGGFTVNRAELRAAGIQYKDFLATLSQQTGRSMQDVAGALRVGRVSVAAGLDALNATVDKKLGPLAEKKFFTIGAATQRLRDTFGRLFDQMDTSKIARALDGFSKWLDDTSVGGAALEKILGSVFDGIGKAIDFAMPYVQSFGDFLLLTFLRIRKALKPVRDWFKDAFSGESEDRVKSFDRTLNKLSKVISDAFVPALITLGIVMSPLIFMAAVLAASLFVMALPLIVGTLAIYGLVKAAMWLYDTITGYDWGHAFSIIGDVATNIVDGLVDGVRKGWTKFSDAMKGMALAGLQAFKDIFKPGSPSKVMIQQGLYIDQGLAQGIDKGKDQPASAMGDMSQGTLGSSPAAMGSSGSSSKGGSMQVTFAEGSIQISGVKDMADIEERLPPLMANLFEQLGLSMGAQVPA